MNSDLSPYKDILANIARHINLNDEEQKFFCSLIKEKNLRKRQYLLQRGDVSRHETFVKKGCLRTYYIDKKGNEHIIQFALEGWWTSDLISFYTGKPATLTIDALEDSELHQLDKVGLDLLYERVPKFERFFRIQFLNALIALSNRMLSLFAGNSEERYLELRERYPDFEKRIPQKYIASFLGLTPESLSRLRKKLSEKK